jgi:probable F420-dependent oxidoreductase
VRIGVALPTVGPAATRAGVLDRARAAEAAGFDGLWVSDHIVQPERIDSAYPYSENGEVRWDPTAPQLEALQVLAAVSAVTSTIELGTSVLVVPQRQSVLLAKQLATLDVLAGGRTVLGAGAGWLAEEFAALEVDFSARGRLLDASIRTLRECWTGTLAARTDGGSDLSVRPVPVRPIPILVGGMSAPAMRRAVALGDGWIAQVDATADGIATLVSAVERLTGLCESAGRDPGELRIAARLSGAVDGLEGLLESLAGSAVDDVIVNAPALGDESAVLVRLRAALA